jgi:Cu-Zn family superoxide dismutase
MRRIIAAAPFLAAGIFIGCESMPDMPWEKKKQDTSKADAKADAVAHIKPSQAASTQPSWGKPSGTVTFTQQEGDRVRVKANLTGLSPGEHGIHIHEKGDLSAPDLMSAGAHYNPGGHKHAGPNDESRHAGDLGNITADASGKAKLDIVVTGISVGGQNDVLGKSVIVHAKADDLKTDPSGNSGGRAGGGVIEKAK